MRSYARQSVAKVPDENEGCERTEKWNNDINICSVLIQLITVGKRMSIGS